MQKTKTKISAKKIAIIFAVIIFSLAANSKYVVEVKDNIYTVVIAEVLFNLSNNNRIENKVPALKRNTLLDKAAQAKANDMAERGYFAHTDPDGNNARYWFKEAGYQYMYGGENLAVRFEESKNVSRAWMDSVTHRANILNPLFTETGLATAKGIYKGEEVTFAVQMFGTPKPIYYSGK